jgi:hypothetical protein
VACSGQQMLKGQKGHVLGAMCLVAVQEIHFGGPMSDEAEDHRDTR